MVAPINYMALIPQPDIAGAAAGLGQELRRIRTERAAIGQAETYRNDLQKTFEAGTPEAFSALIAKYPQQREAFKTSWDVLSQGQKDNEFRDAARVYQALQTNPEVAKQMADERITAEENAGGDTTELKQIRGLMDQDPAAAANYLAFTLSSVDPDKWSKMSVERRAEAMAPAELSAKQSAAQKAAVEANFAESNAVQDLAKGGWDIAKVQNDIQVSRQNAQIAAMNAAVAREESETKRQELRMKIEDKKRERETTVREKAAEIEGVRAGIDNSLSTIDRLLQNPELDNILGAVEGSAFYPSTLIGLASPFSDADQRADATADLQTIQSQSFLNNLVEAKEKGATFGALTEREGERLVGAVRNLSAKQSEEQFRANMSEVQRLLLKSRGRLADKYGVPETLPDRPSVQTTPEQPVGDVPLPETSGFRVLGVE